MYEWLERPQTGDNLTLETTFTQTVQRETAATSDKSRLHHRLKMMSLKVSPCHDKKPVEKTASVDARLQRSDHAPLERQMCLQIPEERPFLRR